ncbi:uncharacterized protein BDV17DRAFT_77899 [Aspergillus undulatus]|uniref:uncharacterized protein n=1 Tax=Aspergillus undulatus TaxID=1810928 RepID=UPI003CCDA65E
MEPFSASVAAIELANVCCRLVKFLRDIRAGVASVQDEIAALIAEVSSLQLTITSVEDALKDGRAKGASVSPPRARSLETLQTTCEQSLQRCENVAKRLEGVVQDIYGPTGPKVMGKRDGLGKESRRREKDTKLQRLRHGLSTEKQNLQILLMGLGVLNDQKSNDKLDRILQEVQSLDQGYKIQIAELNKRVRVSGGGDDEDENEQDIATLSSLRKSLRSVANAISVTTPNEFFDPPQGDALFSPLDDQSVQKQLRFVIYGIGGSGKTQFCSKFAEQNRDSYWGVFTIDASTHERAKQTYAEIAKFGKLEPNQNAAMHWLSNRSEKWLLFIDNADDPRMELHEYFPKGDRGHIIITTRNPAHKVYGNVDPGFFEFQGMEENESSTLLLRAARLAEPWDATSSSWASKIARQLGFLALALIHAGATIRRGMCSLKNYLTFYDENWERIRRTSTSFLDFLDKDEDNMSALISYEVSYRGIEQKGTQRSKDALELLKMFSFLYNKNIRFDILRKAVCNCAIEKVEQERVEKEKLEQPITWYQRYNNMRLSVLAFLVQDRGPQALPSFMRAGRDLGYFDEFRVRSALIELLQMSLVTHDGSTDSYSMHPLVHRWARERPGMSTSEQAVWSHIAATVLSHSILLPPLGATEADEFFRRDILPHIDHVQGCQKTIEQRITENRKRRWYGLTQWPGPGSRFGRAQAIRYAKFSTVFMHNGRWKDAAALQLAVKRYTDGVLGLNQSATRRITLALALTYWNLGRGDEAAELQEAVFQACITTLGPNSHETLMAMDLLGHTRWQQGRYSEAKTLQEHAVEGLIKLKGPKDEDSLGAINNLGRTVAKFYENFDDAKRLLTQAFDGMSEILGSTHIKTLSVKEDLAMLALQMEDNDLSVPLTMLEEVLDVRKEKLGKEHPFTLLAMVNLARIKTALGQHDEAEVLVRHGLSIADRNLGENHIGTLMGRTVLGIILTKQSKFAEAESTLLDVIERQRRLSSHRGDFHPDRLGAIMELGSCYMLQEKLNESIRCCDDAIEGLQRISLKQHPLERKMRERKQKLMERLQSEGNGHQSSSILL